MSHIFKKLKTLMHTYSHAWVLLSSYFIPFPTNILFIISYILNIFTKKGIR